MRKLLILLFVALLPISRGSAAELISSDPIPFATVDRVEPWTPARTAAVSAGEALYLAISYSGAVTYAHRVTHEGERLDPQGIPLKLPGGWWTVSAVWTGSTFLVVAAYEDGLRATEVTAEGAVGEARFILDLQDEPLSFRRVSGTWNGDRGLFAVWRAGDTPLLFAVDAHGAVVETAPLPSRIWNDEIEIEPFGNQFAIAYIETAAGSQERHWTLALVDPPDLTPRIIHRQSSPAYAIDLGTSIHTLAVVETGTVNDFSAQNLHRFGADGSRLSFDTLRTTIGRFGHFASIGRTTDDSIDILLVGEQSLRWLEWSNGVVSPERELLEYAGWNFTFTRSNGDYFFLYREASAGTPVHTVARDLRGQEPVGAPTVLISSPPSQVSPRATIAGGALYAVWLQGSSESDQPALTAGRAQEVPTSDVTTLREQSPGMPAIASNAARAMGVWSESGGGDDAHGIRMTDLTMMSGLPSPIVVSSHAGDSRPQIEWCGDSWCVVWERNSSTHPHFPDGHLFLRRFSENGQPLTEETELVAGYAPAIAWDGEDLRVVYQRGANCGKIGCAGLNPIDLVLLTVDLDTTTSVETVISAEAEVDEIEPDVACDSNGCQILWIHRTDFFITSPGLRLVEQRDLAYAHVRGTTVTHSRRIETPSTNETAPNVIRGEHGYLAVWLARPHDTGAHAGSALYGMLFTDRGTLQPPADGSVVSLVSEEHGMGSPSLAFDGQRHFLVYSAVSLELGLYPAPRILVRELIADWSVERRRGVTRRR